MVGVRQFIAFCSSVGVSPTPPVSPSTLEFFATYMANSVSYKTIKVYLAGVRLWHVLEGLPDPTQDPRLHYAIVGIKRQQGDNTRRRLPITISVLKSIKSRLHHFAFDIADKRMLWAASCVAFYGFLRASEFTCQAKNRFDPDQSLLRQDIIRTDTMFLLKVKASKTDPFRRGLTVPLAQTNTSTCPVSAISKYLMMTPNRALDRPLFQFTSGDFLTRHSLTSILRDLLSSGDYASHSFRIGAATSAAAAGIPDWLIQTMGRWSSQCFQRYIRTPPSTIQSAMRKMAKIRAPDI